MNLAAKMLWFVFKCLKRDPSCLYTFLQWVHMNFPWAGPPLYSLSPVPVWAPARAPAASSAALPPAFKCTELRKLVRNAALPMLLSQVLYPRHICYLFLIKVNILTNKNA